MLKRYKRAWVFAFVVLNLPLLSVVKPVNLESPFKNSWYKKALDACMHVWGDVRALITLQKDMQPEQRTLCFDALIGRLTQADMYVGRLMSGKAVIEEDDIAYLIHVLGLLNHACRKLDTSLEEVLVGKNSINVNEQVQCMLSVLQNIKKRLEAVLGPEFILSKIEQIEN